ASCHLRLSHSYLSHSLSHLSFFFLMIPPPPTSTLFPYTTLFRSNPPHALHSAHPDVHDLLLATKLHLPHPRAQLVPRSHLVERRSEEHTSELQSRENLVCRLLLEKKKKTTNRNNTTTKTAQRQTA